MPKAFPSQSHPMSARKSVTDPFWKEALDSARQGVWDYDIASGIKHYSDTWREIRGLTADGPLPQGDEEWLQQVHPDDRSLAQEQTKLLNAGDLAEVNYEYRERHAKGHWIWIMCRGRAIAWDKAGKPYRFMGTDTDISPLKASEDRIKAVSRRLELALSSGQIGIFQFDIQRRHLEWDTRLRTIYGLPTDNSPLPEGVWERALHPVDFEITTRITYAALETRCDYGLDFRIIRPDGTVRHIRSRVSYQESLNDGPMLIGVNWDTTEEHERHQALTTANELAAIRNVELEAARAEMEYSALHDALTGLPNRRLLDQVQREYAARSDNQVMRAAILHIDLDRFKQINDVLGHDVGDFVLRNTAAILRDCVWPGSLVARVGGDEFAIFVPDAPEAAELGALAEDLIRRNAHPVTYEGHDCRYGISIGIAVAEAGPIDGKALFVNADMALYRAKHEGRGRHCFFTEQMRHQAQHKKQRSDDLLAGLEQGEFFCVYQPQFNAKTQAISGVEALVRWQRPGQALQYPADFLATAEELNVMATIDRLVLQNAVADFRQWAAAGVPVPRLSVNLSQARLRDPRLVAELEAMDLGALPLSFELLESNFLDDQSEIVAGNLAAIRQLGFGIEVDDFGSGHASIVSLLRLKPDRLKIDRALVGPVGVSNLQVQLLRSIVEIGHLQDIDIIAEGVETETQRQLLQAMGCDELQGFFLARPMTAVELGAYLLDIKAVPRQRLARRRRHIAL